VQSCQSRLGSAGADGLLGTRDLWKNRHELLTVISVSLCPALCNGHGAMHYGHVANSTSWLGLATFFVLWPASEGFRACTNLNPA